MTDHADFALDGQLNRDVLPFRSGGEIVSDNLCGLRKCLLTAGPPLNSSLSTVAVHSLRAAARWEVLELLSAGGVRVDWRFWWPFGSGVIRPAPEAGGPATTCWEAAVGGLPAAGRSSFFLRRTSGEFRRSHSTAWRSKDVVEAIPARLPQPSDAARRGASCSCGPSYDPSPESAVPGRLRWRSTTTGYAPVKTLRCDSPTATVETVTAKISPRCRPTSSFADSFCTSCARSSSTNSAQRLLAQWHQVPANGPMSAVVGSPTGWTVSTDTTSGRTDRDKQLKWRWSRCHLLRGCRAWSERPNVSAGWSAGGNGGPDTFQRYEFWHSSTQKSRTISAYPSV